MLRANARGGRSQRLSRASESLHRYTSRVHASTCQLVIALVGDRGSVCRLSPTPMLACRPSCRPHSRRFRAYSHARSALLDLNTATPPWLPFLRRTPQGLQCEARAARSTCQLLPRLALALPRAHSRLAQYPRVEPLAPHRRLASSHRPVLSQ